MQVDPIKPVLKLPTTQSLKLNYDGLVSSFALKFNLRRYTLVSDMPGEYFDTLRCRVGELPERCLPIRAGVVGRDLHSSTFRLNVSAFSGIVAAFRGCLGGVGGK